MSKHSATQQAKAQAERLTRRLQALGLPVAYSQGLEALAAVFGAETWHAYAAELKKPAKPESWNSADGPMTDSQYRQAFDRCPICGSREVEALNAVDLDGNRGVQDIECQSCGSTWQDVYRLEGYYLKVNATRSPRRASRPPVSQPMALYLVRVAEKEGPTSQESETAQSKARAFLRAAPFSFTATEPGAIENIVSQVKASFPEAAQDPYFSEISAVVVPLSPKALADWLKSKGYADDLLDELVYSNVETAGTPVLGLTASAINNEGQAGQLEYLLWAYGYHWDNLIRDLSQELAL